MMKKIILMFALLAVCGTAFADLKVKVYHRPDCPHCRNMVPIVEKFEKEYPSVEFVKINIKEDQESAHRDRVSSVPTFIVYENGKELGGFMGERKYDDFVQSIINPPKRPKPPIDLLPILAWSQFGMQFISMLCLLMLAIKVVRA